MPNPGIVLKSWEERTRNVTESQALVAYACNPSYPEAEIRRILV
jgi:hypothetical protein